MKGKMSYFTITPASEIRDNYKVGAVLYKWLFSWHSKYNQSMCSLSHCCPLYMLIFKTPCRRCSKSSLEITINEFSLHHWLFGEIIIFILYWPTEHWRHMPLKTKTHIEGSRQYVFTIQEYEHRGCTKRLIFDLV